MVVAYGDAFLKSIRVISQFITVTLASLMCLINARSRIYLARDVVFDLAYLRDVQLKIQNPECERVGGRTVPTHPLTFWVLWVLWYVAHHAKQVIAIKPKTQNAVLPALRATQHFGFWV